MTELFVIFESYIEIIINALETALTYIFYFPILDSNLGSIFIVICIAVFFLKLIFNWISHKKDGGS